MRKDPAWYAPPPVDTHIIVANDEDHSRFRKVMSHSFSEKALANQEGLLQGEYINFSYVHRSGQDVPRRK